MNTGLPDRPKHHGVTTMTSTNGATPIGGIRTIPTGSMTITRTGCRSTHAGATAMAITTSSTYGTTGNGGTRKIQVG